MRYEAVTLLIVCGAFLSCSRSTSEGRIMKEELANEGVDTNALEILLVVTDNGCPTCNRDFARFCGEHLRTRGTQVVTSASGQRFDLAPLMNDPGASIWLAPPVLQRLVPIQGSGAIIFQGDRIDTVLAITANDLDASLRFLETRSTGAMK